jgi:hypothetical protein
MLERLHVKQNDFNVNNRDGKTTSRLCIGVAVVAAMVVAGVFWETEARNGLIYADRAVLRATFDRWFEAGQPTGDALCRFMEGRRPDLVMTNRVFVIGGTNYMTQFALTNSMAGLKGTLFISTNRVLIWLDSAERKAQIVNPPRQSQWF